MKRSINLIFILYSFFILGFFLNADPNSGAFGDYQNHIRVINDFENNLIDTLFNLISRCVSLIILILTTFESTIISDIIIISPILSLGRSRPRQRRRGRAKGWTAGCCR